MAVFNREDGQLALGSKTPVSILQEILQKKGDIPTYELIYNGVGTHDPRFKFQVSAEGLTAIGDGKTKKEAKHDAAATLLKRLLANKGEEVPESNKEEVDIASPYMGALKTNYVGTLDEICVINKIPFVNYVLLREEGPPHARVFTMRCNLSSLYEVAVARTKKQAKHLAAQKMSEKVKKILKDRYIPPFDNTEAPEEIVSDRVKIQNGTFYHDLSYRVKDLHNVFHISQDEHPLPSIFLELPDKPEEFYESMEKPMEFLEQVVEALQGVVTKSYLPRSDYEKSVRDFTLDFFKDEYESDEDIEIENEDHDEPSILNVANIEDNWIQDYPVDDEEECDKTNERLTNDRVGIVEELETVKIVEELETVKIVEELETVKIVEDFCKTSFDVCCFIKVETPRGIWAFDSCGRSEEEALNKAARKSLKFLRIMAIPPLQNSS